LLDIRYSHSLESSGSLALHRSPPLAGSVEAEIEKGTPVSFSINLIYFKSARRSLMMAGGITGPAHG
jgi:hypothetical protein